jgi:CheY-like chemotaxis protein
MSWGVQAVSAAGGWEALGVLRDAEAGGQVFDAILLDYHMPGMDGIDFSRRLQADPVLCRIPRILLSSSGRLNAGEAQGAGLSGSLAKPVRARQLYEAITHALGKEVAPQPAEPKAPVVREKRTARLLLVEDNPVNQKVALVTLRRLGYEVDLAGNGVEALEISARQRYDLVFMDCQMPEMDGFEATRALRKREQEMPLPRTPIIALTANALEGDREQCIAAGMDDYLTKPFKREQLEAILDRWLAVPKAPSKAA